MRLAPSAVDKTQDGQHVLLTAKSERERLGRDGRGHVVKRPEWRKGEPVTRTRNIPQSSFSEGGRLLDKLQTRIHHATHDAPQWRRTVARAQ